MRVLLLSAYDADSHRHWRDCLSQGIGEWHWQTLALPARHFSWRIRGNPLYWSVAERQLLEQGYDLILATSMVDLRREKAAVLPVPLDFPAGASTPSKGLTLQLLWNHRWEYDKGPERLLEIVRGLLRSRLEFVLHVVGQQFREQPPAFAELRSLLADAQALGSWGFIRDHGEYLNLLGQCEVALSTALHDFQGLALMQACGAGCSPLAPARLVYPEWLDEAFLYPGDAADPQREAAGAVAKILALAEKRASGQSLPLADVSRFSSDVLLDEYCRVLSAVALLAMT